MKQPDNYWSDNDEYCYPKSNVLINIPNIKDEEALEQFEHHMFIMRFPEAATLPMPKKFTITFLKRIHRICFRDVYKWAGKPRTVRISKGNTAFCYPEYIESESKRIFDKINNFIKTPNEDGITMLASFFGDLNMLHPFRDGNGRTTKILISYMSERIGINIDWSKIDPDSLLKATIKSASGDYKPLIKVFKKISETN